VATLPANEATPPADAGNLAGEAVDSPGEKASPAKIISMTWLNGLKWRARISRIRHMSVSRFTASALGTLD